MAPRGNLAAFKKGEPFNGGVDDYLRLLMGEIMPGGDKELPWLSVWRGIAWDSLVGLFTVYAFC